MGKRKRYIRGDDTIRVRDVVGVISEEDRIFALLVAMDVPANQAYYYSRKKSKASLISCAAPASRLLQTTAIQSFLRTLHAYWEDGRLEFNEAIIKGI